jgi:hypothetical protein
MKESAPKAFTFIGGSKANKRGLQPEPRRFGQSPFVLGQVADSTKD